MAGHHDVQKPLFAPASQGAQGDDFDLNEIFADYFISEFEDPLNAYTSSMANYGGAAASVAMTQQQAGGVPQVAATLPTGGIKTAFHAGAAAAANGGATAAATQQATYGQEPSAKKPRQELPVVHQQQQAVPQQTMAGIAATGVQVPAQLMGAAAMQGRVAAAAVPQGGVQLPVGVGIRLGGIGGVAPSTAQTAAIQTPFNMWGGVNSGAMTEQAVAERRQRNREHAKRSRVRKKFMLESLQEEVNKLQKVNQKLRALVQEHITEHSQQIISECCTSSPLFGDNKASADGSERKETMLGRSDFSLMESLASGQQNFVLSDPRLPDNPIVFASPGFYRLTGYTPEQTLGRNCRFLQGRGTDPKAVDIIRKAVAAGADCTTCILNYKADGTPFWNQFFVAALRDSDNCIVNYVGVQCEVEPEAGATALEDKVNAVLPLQMKDEKDGS